MNAVTFPGLGLVFYLDPVAFTIGSFPVYWYGIIIALGFVLSVLFCLKWPCPKLGIKGEDLLDVLLFAAPGGIVGARLYYIIFYPELYKNPDGSWDIAACFNVHNGGLAIYGGIIAVVIITFFVTRYKKISFLNFVDMGVFGMLLGQCIGRWGNFVNAEAYGGETTLPWRMGIETAKGYLEVHPTFLYESLWNLLGFLLLCCLLKKGHRKFVGEYFFLYIAWYGFGRGLIEGLRADSLYFFSTGIRVSQMIGFATCAVAIILLITHLEWNKKPRKEVNFYGSNDYGWKGSGRKDQERDS